MNQRYTLSSIVLSSLSSLLSLSFSSLSLTHASETHGHNPQVIFVEDIGWVTSRDESGKESGYFVDLDDRPICNLFKLYPWEWISNDTFGKNILNLLASSQRSRVTTSTTTGNSRISNIDNNNNSNDIDINGSNRDGNNNNDNNNTSSKNNCSSRAHLCVIEPAWKHLLGNKAMLAVLWDMYVPVIIFVYFISVITIITVLIIVIIMYSKSPSIF